MQRIQPNVLAALRESEEKFRATFEQAAVGMSHISLDGKFLNVNQKLCDIVGYKREELIGHTFQEITHLDDVDANMNLLQRMVKGELQTYAFEKRYVRKDGSIVWVKITASSVRDSSGAPKYSVGVVEDITARKHAEVALRESEQRYRYLADSMPQIVWTARPDGYFDYYNRRWMQYTGLTLEQTEGWNWQHVLHPDDVERCIKRWANSVQTGERYEIEYRFRRASDGSFRWHLGRALPMRDDAGEIVKWFGTSTDIDDQKRAQESLQFMVEASHLLTSSLDYHVILENIAHLAVPRMADFCLVDMVSDNCSIDRMMVAHADLAKAEAWREMQRRFPLNPAADYTIPQAIRTHKTLVYDDITPEKIAAMSDNLEQAAALQKFGLKSSMIVPLISRGRAIGAITFITAESGRRYTPQDIELAEVLARRAALAIDNAVLFGETQEARRVAEEASRAKDEFLATLSHELRTPLTPIIGWVHMMRSGMMSTGEELAHALGVVERNSQSLTRLINDLLDMSAILSGKMQFDLAPVYVDAAIREAIETVRPQAEQRNIQMDVFYSNWDISISVVGDQTRLVQIFWNLLSNAVEFSYEGSRVSVTCTATEREVRVCIEDEGQGISADFMPHIFDRFRQADSSKTRAHGGLGLGLALVKNFVETHGGSVEVMSGGEGRGSRFTVYLPRFTEAIEDKPLETVKAEASPDSYKSARILVVDDADDTLAMLGVVLKSHGYDVTLCESAEEALRAARNARFDLILSDIGMPQTDGYELMRRLRSMPNFARVPAIALTGYATQRDADAALVAGYDEHLPKPVDSAELIKLIRQMLDKKSGV